MHIIAVAYPERDRSGLDHDHAPSLDDRDTGGDQAAGVRTRPRD